MPVTTMNLTEIHPLRTPAWRAQRAKMLASQSQSPEAIDDDATVQAYRFYRHLMHEIAPGSARRVYPHLAEARAIRETNGPLRWQIEAMLLAAIPVWQIASRLEMEAQIIQVYADLFFDVIGRENTDWAFIQAVRPVPAVNGELTEADLWRYAAAQGGPVLLDILMGDYLQWPDADAAERHRLAEEGRLNIRLDCTPLSDGKHFRELQQQLWKTISLRLKASNPREWERQRLLNHFLDQATAPQDKAKQPPVRDLPALRVGRRKRKCKPSVKWASPAASESSADSTEQEVVAPAVEAAA